MFVNYLNENWVRITMYNHQYYHTYFPNYVQMIFMRLHHAAHAPFSD